MYLVQTCIQIPDVPIITGMLLNNIRGELYNSRNEGWDPQTFECNAATFSARSTTLTNMDINTMGPALALVLPVPINNASLTYIVQYGIYACLLMKF